MSDENPAGHAGETTVPSRVRRTKTETVEANLHAAALKRGTRKKAKARYDADESPIDGDINELLAVEGGEPGWVHFWASERDKARFRGRPWVEEKWGPGCFRPKFYFGEQKRGETIRLNELTLMKMREEHAEQLRTRDRARRDHNSRMQVLISGAKGNFTMQQQLVGTPRS